MEKNDIYKIISENTNSQNPILSFTDLSFITPINSIIPDKTELMKDININEILKKLASCQVVELCKAICDKYLQIQIKINLLCINQLQNIYEIQFMYSKLPDLTNFIPAFKATIKTTSKKIAKKIAAAKFIEISCPQLFDIIDKFYHNIPLIKKSYIKDSQESYYIQNEIKKIEELKNNKKKNLIKNFYKKNRKKIFFSKFDKKFYEKIPHLSDPCFFDKVIAILAEYYKIVTTVTTFDQNDYTIAEVLIFSKELEDQMRFKIKIFHMDTQVVKIRALLFIASLTTPDLYKRIIEEAKKTKKTESQEIDKILNKQDFYYKEYKEFFKSSIILFKENSNEKIIWEKLDKKLFSFIEKNILKEFGGKFGVLKFCMISGSSVENDRSFLSYVRYNKKFQEIILKNYENNKSKFEKYVGSAISVITAPINLNHFAQQVFGSFFPGNQVFTLENIQEIYSYCSKDFKLAEIKVYCVNKKIGKKIVSYIILEIIRDWVNKIKKNER